MSKGRRMTEGKRNIIAALLQEYDIQSAEDIQDALKDLLGGTLEEMLQAEMTERLGYKEYERSASENARNGLKQKKVRSKYGEVKIDVPQDRESSFEPKVIGKRKKYISGIEDKIIGMYAKRLTTRQISEQIEDIYGFDVSEGLVSDITDKTLPQIEEWQRRPLSGMYPVVFVDAVYFSVKSEGIVRKLAAYVILGVSCKGYKEVLGLYVGENESGKYWLGILNDLKNRGAPDIIVLCADGLFGMKEAICAAYPRTEYQRCIVHQVRNTLKYVGEKTVKNLRTISGGYIMPPTKRRPMKRCFRSQRSGKSGIQTR